MLLPLRKGAASGKYGSPARSLRTCDRVLWMLLAMSFPMEKGHPPRHMASARRGSAMGFSSGARSGMLALPSMSSSRETRPRDFFVSKRVAVPRSRVAIRPAPQWRIRLGSAGSVLWVMMYFPKTYSRSKSALMWFQMSGAICHSEMRRGFGPRSREAGSDRAYRREDSVSIRNSERAYLRARTRFPTPLGPRMTTHPQEPSKSLMARSALSLVNSIPQGVFVPCFPMGKS